MKSKTSSDMENLMKNSNKLYQDYKDKIVDIILFGSFAKNKSKPNDIDVAVILKNTKEAEFLTLMKKFGDFFDKKVHLNLILIETIFTNPLFKILLNEGVSLLNDKPLYERFGYESGAVFSINLTKLEKSRKVLFYYALHGKKEQEGILKKNGGKLIGRSVVFIPVKFIDDFKAFLEGWNVDFYRMDVLRG